MELTHQTFYVEVVPHASARANSRFHIVAHLFDSARFNKDYFFPLKSAPDFKKTLVQKKKEAVSSTSFSADPAAGFVDVLFHPVPDRLAINLTTGNLTAAPSASRRLLQDSAEDTAHYQSLLSSVATRKSSLQSQGVAAVDVAPLSGFSSRSTFGKHNQNFSTPGVFWTQPTEPWKHDINKGVIQYMVFWLEVTDLVDKNFQDKRDHDNDLPAKLKALSSELGQDAVSKVFKDPNEHTMWTVCGLLDPQNANKLPPDGNISSDATKVKWLIEDDLVVEPDGRFRVTIKDLKNDNNNVYLVNVMARHTVTGEHAVYEMLTIQNETPVYTPPSLGSQDYAMIIGVSVSVFSLVVIFAGSIIYYTKRKVRPRVRIKR